MRRGDSRLPSHKDRVAYDFGRPVAHRSRTREVLLETIRSANGLHKSALCRASGRVWGVVSHHVHALQRERRIVLERFFGQTWVFPASLPDIDRKLRVLLSDHTASAVLADARVVGPTVATASAQRTGLKARAVRKTLRRMVDLGLAELVSSFPTAVQAGPAVLAAAAVLGVGEESGAASVA